MKATVEDGTIKLDITDLVNHMDEDARKVFYQEIVFEEKLLEACMDFLVSNYAFDDAYHSTNYGTIISRLGDRLKAKCLPLMEQAAQELIKNLQADLRDASANYEKYRRHAWKLEREWPRIEFTDERSLTNEEIAALGLKRIPPHPVLK